MAPPNPKRPPRPPRPPGTQASQDSDVELPFDDDEVDPLQADDPRPQRVPQYPAGSRRSRRHGPGARANSDRELASRFDTAHEYSDPGYVPAFVYVERGPGAGQLVPVKQGTLVIGRSSSSDLRLQHPSISRRHAHLTRRGDRFFLKDLGSQNGTFLNRHRIDSEVELMAGDEVSLGNALLRLRGHGGTPARGVPQVTSADAPPPRKALGSLGVALGAAALGAGVAALIALLSMRLLGGAADSAPLPPSASARPAPATTSTPGAAAVPSELKAGAGTAPTASNEGGAAATASEMDVAPDAPAATDNEPPPYLAGNAASARALQEALTPKPTGISAANVARGTTKQGRPVPPTGMAVSEDITVDGAKAEGRHRVSPGARATSTSAAQAPAGATAKESEVLRHYEAGNVAAARDLARSAKLGALHEQLVRFESAEAAARGALAKRNVPEAIHQLTLALSVDDALAHGWSKHGPPLRKQLSRLHLQVGVEHAAAGRADEARTAFEQALKHDTGNREAREHLARLNAASAP